VSADIWYVGEGILLFLVFTGSPRHLGVAWRWVVRNTVVLFDKSIKRLLYGRPGQTVAVTRIVRPDVPTGIEFVFETAKDKLTQQLASIDQLDTKAGVLVGVLGAAIGVFVQFGHFDHTEKVVIAAILLLATTFATFSFLVRKYKDAPDPARVIAFGQLQPDEIKTLTLHDLINAKNENETKLVLKGRLINASVFVAGTAILYAFFVHVV
jgi:hypothetical protein